MNVQQCLPCQSLCTDEKGEVKNMGSDLSSWSVKYREGICRMFTNSYWIFLKLGIVIICLTILTSELILAVVLTMFQPLYSLTCHIWQTSQNIKLSLIQFLREDYSHSIFHI